MWTVPTVKSEHMELTRGSLIARETAWYSFHVSESITHGYVYQVLGIDASVEVRPEK
jgi:hypothetical protein